MELVCPVKTYHWGKAGLQSLVAVLKQNANSSFKIDHKEMYAELWMGTHPSGPAIIKSENILLEKWILQHPSVLGEKAQNLFGNNLPFLFKILSVGTPLSIQVHPSKETAQELNFKNPEIYRDSNHKPELAIALSDFEALCGFRPIEEIKKFLKDIPELSEVIGNENVNDLLTSDEATREYNLKKCFTYLMTASEEIVATKLELLLQRITAMSEDVQSNILGFLFKKIYNCYPGDVGCFCIYFFNYLRLKPGESIYLGANEPHAYITGDCVECMACSDNVVRAGLTPKFRDTDTLCKILDYKSSSADSKILYPVIENDWSVVFKPPVPEFAVCKLCLLPGKEYNLQPRESASIIIIINGSAKINDINVRKGKIFFLVTDERPMICVQSTSEPFLAFQAFVNV